LTYQEKLPFTLEQNLTPVSPAERASLQVAPGFGQVFTDHMVTIHYSERQGWHSGKIQPMASLNFHPGTMVLHYAQEIFEGLKAYRQPDGGGALFRPGLNARRFANSAERLAMPALPEDLFLASVRALARVDCAWIPEAEQGTLYMRPFMIGTEVVLGTKPSPGFLYCVIASLAGSYFGVGTPAISLWVSETIVRAAAGGTGAAKCGGNYAAGMVAQMEGKRQGCDQVIYLDAAERRWAEELNGMNVFFVFDDGSLQTPPLTGTILPGVTRDSLITLARDLGHVVREAPYAIDQWQQDANSGKLTEAFACGTAAVVTPIGRVKGPKHNFTIGKSRIGPITHRLKSALTDIQYGRAPDDHQWVDRLF
jgi:branched-chain amino acid aminotransferase